MLLSHLLVLRDFLASSQVTEVQFSFEDMSMRVRLGRFNQQLEDCVRA